MNVDAKIVMRSKMEYTPFHLMARRTTPCERKSLTTRLLGGPDAV
jgi:hypothetical protein